MARIRHRCWRLDIAIAQPAVIPGRPLLPSTRPALEPAQFHAKNCGLKRVHAVIETAQDMMIFALLAPVAQHAHHAIVGGVVGDNNSTLAAGAEVLTRVETKT